MLSQKRMRGYNVAPTFLLFFFLSHYEGAQNHATEIRKVLTGLVCST